MRALLMTKKKQPTKWGPLCFTAETAGVTIKIAKSGGPTAVSLETSTDWNNWRAYTINNLVILANIWDKVYFRNTSETDTGFSTNVSTAYYYFIIQNGQAACSWDVTYLLNKNGTTTLSNNCFGRLFYQCTNLTACPELPATTLANNCYHSMFYGCSGLKTLPKLPAITMTSKCYYYMFHNCSQIKLSTTQTWEYQTPYRIPLEWTWTTASDWSVAMFYGTWWTYTWSSTWNLTINTTYYTSNTVV